ncbi:cation:proton antiporter [Longimicrobium sp.]|jgi:Kef-type K+ transport system membrane component KefB|uniref:cation:proton antiporter domain-containing protein n=1 Tax=Longimicrobium sp. TaxID=2029185 RepID=UPI002EDB6FC0
MTHPEGRRLLATGRQYFLFVVLPVLAVLAILQVGGGMGASAAAVQAPPPTASSPRPPLPDMLLLLAQIGVIVIAARGLGYLFRRIGQPQVVGEMAAGLMLGPSLLGWVAPGVTAALFPAASLGFLSALSQVGLLVFMFLVGVRLDPQLLRNRGHTAVVTSHVSIAAPFLLGTVLALAIHPTLAPKGVSFTAFALFMGAAMSVTAFPVLARILAEKRLTGTRLGAVTLACAAVDDVTAWSILAGVVMLVRSGDMNVPLWVTVVGSAAFAVVMITLVRAGVARALRGSVREGTLSDDGLAFILLLALLSALVTEYLGVHALFGAFLAGAVVPKEPGFVRRLTDKLEDVTVVLLLPLFFAFTGLRTSIGLVSGWEMWLTCAAVIAVAVAGKFGGSTLAARATGMSWRDASALGVLMNTRGLMELVILNVGLDLGVISPALFAMMVLMALVTTFMTTPLLDWILGDAEPAVDEPDPAPVLALAATRA